MYCKSCLAANPEGATKCVQCGAPLENAIPASPPPSTAGGGDFELQPEHVKPASAFEPPPLPVAPVGSEAAKSEAASTEEKPVQPPDHKQNSIILLVVSLMMFPGMCCCGCLTPLVGMVGLLFSILALIEGSKVKPAYEAGDYAAAEEASKAAQKWLKTGIIAAGAIFALVILFNVVWAILYGMASITQGFNKHFGQ